MKSVNFEKTIKIIAILIAILLCLEFGFAYYISSKKQAQIKNKENLKTQIKQNVEKEINKETEPAQQRPNIENKLRPEDVNPATRPSPLPPPR